MIHLDKVVGPISCSFDCVPLLALFFQQFLVWSLALDTLLTALPPISGDTEGLTWEEG